MVFTLFADGVDLSMSCADFFVFFVVSVSMHPFGFALLLLAEVVLLLLLFMWSRPSSCSMSSVGTQTDACSQRWMSSGRQSHFVAGWQFDLVHAGGSFPGAFGSLSRLDDSELQSRRADAVSSAALAAGHSDDRIRQLHQQEQALVMRVILGLGHRCCGCSGFNIIGTNQFFIRVKCSHCSRVCLRYRRSA